MNSHKNTKNRLITPEGQKRFEDEAKKLWEVDRPHILVEIQDAAAQGDRSENAEYIYGRKRLREIDKRLQFVGRLLNEFKVIDPLSQKHKDFIDFGATVTIEDENGLEKCYQIVGEDEVEPSKGKISWRSPVGYRLLKKKVGDFIEVSTPNGIKEYTILHFSYK